MSYYIMLSYPSTHIDTTSDDLNVIRERCSSLAGQVDDELYFWVEMDCPKHGRQPMTNHCECQVCDREQPHEDEQVEPLTEQEMAEINAYEAQQQERMGECW